MRKAQKEQAQNFIQLLQEAHGEILSNLQKKNYEPVLVTLADCQDGAIALGNLIEEAEGEGFVTISYLEKYCEVVFQIYNGISEGQFVDVVKIEKSLRKALTQIENSVRDDIRVRREIVFFPYKASMWDSLESIYLAAKEDPDCDAYCVPIPYFDRNADGSLGQMHYEGNEYPKNIEVTSYLAYSVEDRKPDSIYIHNPYDDYNRVTSVHPNFYSSRLKNYTDELVYIPYFVLSEIEPEDEAAIEANKHFFSVPAVFHAHKVIVQSEKMRQVYIKSLTKQFGEESRTIWEEKILGLGSPKFDKVLNTKKEDVEIPEEWLKIIEKPDGGWKKIIFYNTSIGALLEHNEKMLEKMKSVFETFKENKDEVALLWRPHPLIQSTVQSMRPQLWTQYKDIVEQYKAEGWGIYDDTTDMNRAIALSDAYYGDESSVVQLCQKARMPVMIQNVTNDGCSILLSDGACLVGNNIWIIDVETNSLCTMNIENAQINSEFFFEDKERRSIYRLCENEGKIYGFPGIGKQICRYDPEIKRMEYFTESTENEIWCHHYAVEKYNNQAYLFPMFSSDILKIDLMNLENIEHISLSSPKDKYTCYSRKYLTKKFVRCGKNIIIPSGENNKLLIFDLESNKYEWKQIGYGECGFEDIEKGEESIFLLTNDKRLIEMSYTFTWQREYLLEEEYSFIVACKQSLILVPKHDNKFLKINLKDGKMDNIEYPNSHVLCKWYLDLNQVTFSDFVRNERETILLPRFNNMLVRIDHFTGMLSFKEWTYSEKYKENIGCRLAKGKSMLNEGVLNLQDYISVIQ